MVRKTACVVYTEIMEAFLGIMLENRRGARVDDWGGLENRCGFRPTVGSNPTLSAGYKIPRGSFRLHLLPDLIVLVVRLSKCKESATEIAQFALGDLAFILHTLTRCEGFPPRSG